MLLWVGFAVLTAAVVAALLRPLLAVETREAAQSGDEGSSAVSSGAVYRDQLAEIEAERARGLIGEAEADAARVEIARRLLATADTTTAAASTTTPASGVKSVAMLVAAALPVLAIISYLTVGAPGRPGQPFAERAAPPGTTPGVAQLVAKVEERLRAHPEDGKGWDVIAPVYLRLGRYGDAADAFQRAVRLLGESPQRLAGLAEAHVLASDGVVTEVARAAYERLRALAPDELEPRFWLAVAAEQDGRIAEAAAEYEKLLAEGESDAAWRPAVTARWKVARSKLGLATDAPPKGGGASAQATAQAPPPVVQAPGDGAGKAPALSKEALEAVQGLTPDARRQLIEEMVAGLDKRLSENGRDLEGWQRLIRAYAVLGRRDDAQAALARARAALAEEAQSLEVLAALARTLGLSS